MTVKCEENILHTGRVPMTVDFLRNYAARVFAWSRVSKPFLRSIE